MRPNSVYSVFEQSQAITGADILIELQPSASYTVEIWRMWCGAAENDTLVDQVQEIEIYGNDAVATGGTALTSVEIQGDGDGSTGVTELGGATIGATPYTFYPDAFHVQNGWLYLPVPEERIRVVGAKVVGFRFPTAPASSITVSYGIIYAQYI